MDARARETVDIGYPDDYVEFFRQHRFSGIKEWVTPTEAQSIAQPLRDVSARMASTVDPAIPFFAQLPWPITSLPADIVAALRLRELAPLAEVLLGGSPARVVSWQVFARRAGDRATPIHADGPVVPIDGPGVAFWIPVTQTPERTGLVALADVDGTGPRPVRQGDQDAGDLTWHDLSVLHWAEDPTADFVALGLGVYPDGARIDLGTDPNIAVVRGEIVRRVCPGLTTGDVAVGEHMPLLADLPA
jgi:hypothetical protein